jgi:hypothetical protein
VQQEKKELQKIGINTLGHMRMRPDSAKVELVRRNLGNDF